MAEGVDDPKEAITRRASRLLDQVEAREGLGTLPVDLDLVASFAGIARVNDIPGLAVVAHIRPTDDKQRSLIVERRAEDPHGRRRFSLGHEIGHTLFPDFWTDPRACRPTSDDPLAANSEDAVEGLCDQAAAELLLPARLVRPFMRDRELGMDMVLELAGVSESSLFASGRRLVDLSDRPAAFAVFTPRLSKAQVRLVEQIRRQPSLPGFAEQEEPQPRFRLDYSHGSPDMVFLPREKSFSADPFTRALGSGEVEHARDEVNLHGRTHSFEISVLHAPLRIEGEIRDRYLATVIPA
ncbi:MAG: ImmA/IrrE family metallo-endopeptidase [Chloroflexi bacterium]|nr:ImmA/IrrE family metallo-endopeptidase [Chloroflexota bacterium]